MAEGHPAPGGPECYRHPGRETWIRCQRCEKPICPDCMRDAAVGFQCPDCVTKGAKETRSGRAAYGGTRSADPRLTSMVLIGICVVIWGAIRATGGSASELINRLSLMPVGKCVPDSDPGMYFPGIPEATCSNVDQAAHWVPGVADGAPWLLVTNMFTHVEVFHILFNMMALWFLGPMLEAAVGRVRFLAIYLGSGLVASVTVLVLASPSSITLGASGAICGLLAGHLIVGRKVGADLQQLMLWIGLMVLTTIMWSSSISWQGHLGGFVGGTLLTTGIVYAPRGPRRSLVQWSAVLAVLLVAAVIGVLRVNALT
ncbi:rhomboid family intramembrane serine protease [Nocardioides alcanivorans]|uniref:rhomboid family intramembrane serine protease n=1 Tax=Nocardioides alcanivorans TaxID=2897352 RepID=UPI001F20051B|nr:rhomboid family intramembrane serine protease [Nocardioides alcanivorans]